MGNKYYARLAADNIKKNKRVYLPYIITCVLMTAMIYIIGSLAGNPDLRTMKRGSAATPVIMSFGTIVTAVFAFIFLFYTNSYLLASIDSTVRTPFLYSSALIPAIALISESTIIETR